MRRVLLTLLLLWPAALPAAVLNVELKFAPYTGDPKEDHVETVPGKAHVFINGVPFVDQDVKKDQVPVLFDEREIAAPVWIPVRSMGPAVRKGRNTIRIEFEPTDQKTPYHAQLRWATVTDQVKEEGTRSTNQADEGVENKDATGKVVLEHAFVADFATDAAWHHLPAVTALTDDDRQKLSTLVKERAEWFKPDFAQFYKALGANPDVKVAEIRKAKCIDAAYRAGVRVAAPTADELEIVTTGNPEVVLRRRNGNLFLMDAKAASKLKGDTEMCAGVALAVVYPPRLMAVRTETGAWEAVY